MTQSASLYVYYRIPDALAQDASAAAEKAFALLEGQAVSRPRLMRRPGADANGTQTWMEIYDPWRPDWEVPVARALQESGLAALIQGGRHEELFVDFDLHASGR